MKNGQFPAVLPLASLDGRYGFKIDGETKGDLAGFVAGAGDVNGDRLSDILIGAPHCALWSSCSAVGHGYVVFGDQAIGKSGVISLSDLNGQNGFKLIGETTSDATGGYGVSSAGDINNDGYDDILIGGYGYNANTGRSYVVFGGSEIGKNRSIPLSSLNGSNGFKLEGEASNDYSGIFVSGAADVNNDGYSDLLIGAPYRASNSGRGYAIFGGKETISNTSLIQLSTLNGVNGFKIDGEVVGEYIGRCLNLAGDVNSDGIDDFIIGGYGYNNIVGRSYVVFGSQSLGKSGLFSLSSLNGMTGFKLDGEASNDYCGHAVNRAGDVNGDGNTDLFIGAPGHNSNTGRSYVVFGGSDVGRSGLLPLSSLNGVSGFKLDGESASDSSAFWPAGTGDINGDGFADLLIGAYGYKGNTGRSYVVFGGSKVGNEGIIPLSNLNGVNGFKLDGEIGGDQSGYSISVAGDINGDGLDDLLIGAMGYNSNTGRSYVIFGDSPPVLVSNQLNISVGASVQINATHLSAYDLNHNNDTLLFIPSGVVHGRFESSNNLSIPLANFTQQRIRNGEIRFVHDGTSIAPGYSIMVRSEGIAYVASTLAKITFTGLQLPLSIFPAVVPLSSLNGKTGFKIDGEKGGDYSGVAVSSVGDTNSDGYEDLIIGAYFGGNGNIGRSYVVFGGPAVGSSGLLLLSSLNGNNGYKLDGEAPDPNVNLCGYAVDGAGDINHDGIADLFIGANNHDSSVGRSYVVFGGPQVGRNGLLPLSSLNGANGFKLDGEAHGSWSGVPLRGVEDINGDGYDDVLIGAGYYINGGPGRSYVVFGGPGVGSSGVLPLSSLNGNNGFKIDGEVAGDGSGTSVSAAGDVNDDGYTDLLIGSPGHNSHTGRNYVIFGGPNIGNTAVLALSNLNGINGFKLDGEVNNDENGMSVDGVGDVNGDGITDLLIGAPFHNNSIGRSYVVWGGSGIGKGGSFSLSTLNGVNGFKLDGETVGDANGYAVSKVGDINGDGIRDLLIGAPGYNKNMGCFYLIFGGSEIGGTGLFSLSNLNGVNGFRLDGESIGDQIGDSGASSNRMLNSAGDLNGDGIDDLCIGAEGHNSKTGRSYVVFGDVAPQLIVNHLMIHQNQTVVLTNQNLNATDFNHPAASLRFNITQVQHGYFSLVNSTNQSITSFNQSQIWSGQVEFVHDGSQQAPNYTVQVQSDGLALSPPPQTANISFYRRPVLSQNNLLIHQSETVLITTDNLNVTDDYPSDQVLFTIRNLQHGQFQLVPAIPISQFNQQQLLAQKVLFVQDGSANTPSYQVTVSDPYFTLPTDTVNMIFYRRPVIENNQLVIHQGETVKMATSLLNVTDDYPDDEVVFTVSNVQQGHFQLTLTNTTITQFTQKQLKSDQVWFVQEGGANAPSYQVGVNDPYFTLPPNSLVATTFYRQPFITVNQLLIHQGETVVMTASQLNGVDDYPPSQIIFTTDQIEHGKFQLLPSNSTVQQFTQEQLSAKQILFTQDNTADSPNYRVGISDPYFNRPAMSEVTTTFYRRPSFIRNQLQISEGATVLITANDLSLQDDYPDTQVLFIINDCQNGQFELIPAKNTTTIQFTQQQIHLGQIQFVHNNKPIAPSYQVTASDGYFTVGPVSSVINFTLVDKPPALLNPIPPETFAIGEAFNFKIAADTFYDEQGKPIRLSSTLADGLPLPKEITFDPPTSTFTGLVNSPFNYNISVTGTSVAPLATTTFFMLQISGQTPSSSLIDMKTLASVAGSIAGIALTVLSYLYTKYHFRNKREFEHPFANALHQRLNLSYLDFFDKDGKEYATLVDRMMALVKTKNGVDIEALQNSQRAEDKALYHRYADVFAAVIARHVRTNSVYCGCSRELHLRGLNNKCETIVNEVVQQISQQPDEDKRIQSSRTCWSSLFCCQRTLDQNVPVSDIKTSHSGGNSIRLDSTDGSLMTPLIN